MIYSETSDQSRILIVEDDPVIAMGLKHQLKSLGYQVSGIASSAKQAIEQAAETVPHLVLMDILLEGDMDGTEAATSIRSSLHIPIVFVTAHTEDSILEKAKVAEPFGYLVKPYGAKELRGTIEMALCKSRAEQALVRAKEEWERTFDTVPDLIMILDSEHRIIRANKATADRLRVPPEDLVGRTCFECIYGEAALSSLSAHSKLVLDGTPHRVEVTEQRFGGVWSVSVSPLHDETGRTIGSVYVAHDITDRQRAEVELREREACLRAILNNAPFRMWLKDREGRYLAANDILVEFCGLQSTEEVIGKTDHDLWPPEQAELYRTDDQEVMKEKRTMHVEVPLAEGGSTNWFEAYKTPILDEDGKVLGTAGFARDITDRKLAEQKLQWSETLLRQMASSSPLGYLVVDIATDEILYFNHRFCEIWGTENLEDRMRNGELKNKDIAAACLPLVKDVNAFGVPCRPLQINEDAPAREDEIELVDDRTIRRFSTQLLDEKGNSYGRFYIFEDISDRKRAEMALRKQHEIQRTLLSSVPAYVYFKDKNSVYLAGNRLFSELSGIPEDQIPGKTDYEFFSKTDADTFRKDDAEIIATREPRLNYEVNGTDRAGNPIWYSTSKAPFFDPAGEVMGLVGICIDITDLKRTQELLVQSERYRAVADLAGGVAHNFNNLFQIVSGYLELALMDLKEGNYAEVNDRLEVVLNSSQAGAETVRRLLSFAGLRNHAQIEEKGVFDLSVIVAQALDMSKTWWKSLPEKQGINISLYTELKDGCFVQGDKNELLDVVVILIRNASEALPDGGVIRVETTVVKDQVILRLGDSGIGISKENFKRLFNPFFTTKAQLGSGLGLATSRKIIQNCGGDVLVESSAGTGTTFTILLPLAQQESEQARPTDEVSGPRLTILVIDDMKEVLKVVKAGLTRFGYSVITASSGEQGLELFKETALDLVICDLGMPGVNGWEVGEKIRATCRERGVPKTPFILLTGWSGQESEARKIDESGVDGVIEKPVDIENIVKIIRKLGQSKPSEVSDG